ncbi:MAG: hypothetical protein CMN29_35270 [Sandaracinus sp.]|nr:hypothetical protein [Myxococcales bacterium]MAT30138.1 hypothetical protein [Sandaracinus sp.]
MPRLPRARPRPTPRGQRAHRSRDAPRSAELRAPNRATPCPPRATRTSMPWLLALRSRRR